MSVFDFYNSTTTTTTTSDGSDYFTDTNSTWSSSFSMPEFDVGSDDWMIQLADRLFHGNGTALWNAVCEGWAVGSGGFATTAPTKQLTDHVLMKTIGWMVLVLLKTVVFEHRFDRIHRFLNLGSTLVPFAMAMWTIGIAMVRERTNNNTEHGNDQDDTHRAASTMMMTILWNHLISDTSPVLRNWIVASLVSILVRNLVARTSRSSKWMATIRWIPGVLAASLSLACRLFGETTLVKLLAEEGETPGTLLLASTLLRWAADILTGWYCYAFLVSRVFGTNNCTSFPWFAMVVVAGNIAVLLHSNTA